MVSFKKRYIGSPFDRLLARVAYSEDLFNGTPCWLWTGSKNRGGYGQIKVAKKTLRTHCLAYTLIKGPVPEGLYLDHLCRVKECCNPDHLEPVTCRENTLRGAGWLIGAKIQLAKTHCPQGHEYSEENTYRQPSNPNHRHCKLCLKRRNQERKKPTE